MPGSPDNQRLIRGDYRLTRTLGEGTFGETFLATRRRDSLPVAVKLLKVPNPPIAPDNEEMLSPEQKVIYWQQQVEYLRQQSKQNAEFSREATIHARLRHPNIVPFLEYDIDNNEQPFIVMAYALKGALNHYKQKGRPLSPEEAADLVLQAANAIQYAHNNGVIHRDLKPANLLLHPEQGEDNASENLRIWVADFGIAIPAHSERSLQPQNMAGTLPYMAPEQIEKQAVKESDQYALAVISYELLTGKRPFEGNDWAIIHAHTQQDPPSFYEILRSLGKQNLMNPLLEGAEQVVRRGLAKTPQERFQSVATFAQELMNIVKTAAQEKQHGKVFGPAKPEKRKKAEADPTTINRQGNAGEIAKAIEKIQENPDPQKESRKLIAKGDEYYGNKEYEVALEFYNQAIELDPKSSQAFHNKSIALGELGRLKEALTAYDQAIRLDPKDSYALLMKGNALNNLSRYEEAIQIYDEALRIYPNSFESYYFVFGKIYALDKLDRYEEVIQAYDKILPIPENIKPEVVASADYSYINALLKLGRYEEALRVYDKATWINPTNSQAFYNKGITLEKLGRYEEALQEYRNAYTLEPSYNHYEWAIHRVEGKMKKKKSKRQWLYNKFLAVRISIGKRLPFT